ncbi:MAG: hypothetical protein CM15mP121_0690 [Bacteroidota bacterium]|nr:MAG: hypothetical protein CM15mP121_0690 [Bacteroidota bacterium]
MNVLILGSGGREHCFAELISKSKSCDKLFVAPGNSGTSLVAENLDISPTDFDLVKGAIVQHNIQLVVVGPEDPWSEEYMILLFQIRFLKELK